MTPARRLLLVHAHPDDETIGCGATMAHYAAQGVQVTLVTCTLGELGEVLVPDLAGLSVEYGDQLGGYRMSELAAAMRALGVADHRYLGGAGRWRDSGMIGTAGNDDPRAFWRCASDGALFTAALEQLAAVIREVRPHVLVTYDERGGYGHPDHIMAHRVALAALDRAAAGPGEGWTVQKVYFTANPRSVLQQGIDAVHAGQTSFTAPDRSEQLPMGNDDDEVTTAIDATSYLPAKRSAMQAHATQITVEGEFFALSNGIGMQLSGIEYYRLARGALSDERATEDRETDLFDGVEL